MDSFIKTAAQQELLQKIEQLIPLFQAREPELDQLHSFPFANFQDLKNIHYPTLTLPKEVGGQGGGLYDFILAQEAISEGCGATGLSIGWHVGTVLEYAENHHWHEHAGNWLLQKIAEGALINTAASENNAGSPTRGALPRTTACLRGDHYIINGEKTFTSAAPILDYFLVTATNEQQEVVVAIIPRQAPGVSIHETWDMVAMRGTASHDLLLNNVEIPTHYILRVRTGKTAEAKGWQLHIPACYLGIAAAARNYAVQFAATYIPTSLGQPIATTPAIGQLIAQMEYRHRAARHLLYSTIERYELTPDKTKFNEGLAIAKIEVTHAAIEVVDLAMKIVGARALSAGCPLHRYYLHVRAGLSNPPMEDLIKNQFAQERMQLYQP